MAIYMKLGDIKGDATQSEHKDWITLGSMQFGIGRGISTPVGSAKSREASHPSVSEITVSKAMDGSSFGLIQEAVIGAQGLKCEIHIVSNDNKIICKYELENTLISGYSVSTGGDQPTESLSLNFTKFSFTYNVYDKDAKTLTPQTTGYDITTATKV